MSTFVICIDNHGNLGSLILGKVYRQLQDSKAVAHGMVRVIDEDVSETDGYLYPAAMFVPVDLPEEAERALLAAIV